MDDLKVKVVKRQTLNQRVYENIKASILDGGLAAGSKLSEVQMAKHLGVSPTPVREAFRMLSMEGLVKIEPWKGAVVQRYSRQETLEATQCREALESLALRLLYEKMQDDDIKAIETMIEQSNSADTISDFVQINSAIHDIWIMGCGNQKIIVLMSQINDVLLHDRNISATDTARKKEIIDEHLEILYALKARNLQRASAALSSHIYNGYEYSIQHLAETEKNSNNSSVE